MTTFLTLGLLRENRKIGKRENRENPIHRIKSYLGSGSDPDPYQSQDPDPSSRMRIRGSGSASK